MSAVKLLILALALVRSPLFLVIGALALRPLNEFTRIYLGSQLPGLHLVIFGLILILVMLFMPRGLTPPLARAYDRLATRLVGKGGE